MWIVRDADGGLFLFTARPFKKKYAGLWFNPCEWGCTTELPCELFPEVKWTDDEPTEVELVIKTKEK